MLKTVQFESVRLDIHGAIVQRTLASAQQLSEVLGNGVRLELSAIPAGTFLMGAPRGEGYADERPQHAVRLAPFYMSQYPITQAQWQQIMGNLPPCRCPGAQRPVDRISWYEATAFCQRLSVDTGHSYALPSESQWEYACRAGTTTAFSVGETLTTEVANYNGEFTYRREPKGPYRHVACAAGSFPPNPFGLYDMHGTVWEWCADPWHPDYVGAPEDGGVWHVGGDSAFRIVRGGSWHDNPDICRSATRLKFNPDAGEDYVGFRVVMSLQS